MKKKLKGKKAKKLNKLKLRARKRKTKIVQHGGRPPSFTTQQLLNAIEDSSGNIRVIAERMSRPYSTIYKYLKNKAPEDIKEILELEREKVVDIAEETVEEMMQQGIHYPTKLNAAKFVLTSSPKSNKRGYKDKKELTLQGGDKPIEVRNENVVSLDKLKTLSVADRKKLLEEMEEEEENENQD